MRNVVIGLIALLALARPANALTLFSLDAQAYLLGPDPGAVGITPVLEGELLVLHDLSETFGFFGYASLQVNAEVDEVRWSEFLFGPTVWIVPGLQLGAGFGLEIADVPLRGTATLALTPDLVRNVSLSAAAEYGGSGFFYTANGGYGIGPFRFGVMAERYAGIGPRFDLVVPGTPIRFWASGMYDFDRETLNAVVALSFDCVNTTICSAAAQ